MKGLHAHAVTRADIDPRDLLDALDVGVIVLTDELDIAFANARWDAWTGAHVAAGTSFASLLVCDPREIADDLNAVIAEGTTREMQLTVRAPHTESGAQPVACIVRARGTGLVVEARPDNGDGPLGMHTIARQLAEVTDMAEVLRTLCDIAMRLCGASGAAVLRVHQHRGEVVAVAGDFTPARGRTFELAGSLLAKVIAELDVVGEENYSESGRPLMREVPELAVGPILMAPLRAHGDTLGVIAVGRGVSAATFGAVELERLRVLADHAALALHKSLLLMLAQSADRAKGRFLATMSHELRTPLTALSGYNELLADQVIGPMSDPQLDILERMRSVTMHLSAMIEEILAFTSLEEGREVVRPSEFLAADLVRSAIAVVQPLADQKHLVIDVKLPRESVRMTNDIDKSRQILVNLLGNALKFTDRGRVLVRMCRKGSSVRIDIEDTGIGIPNEELSRLFRPFVQVDSGLTRRHGGTGLGLYISRRLSAMLGGHIEVESTPNVGSTFTVVFPLAWERRPSERERLLQ